MLHVSKCNVWMDDKELLSVELMKKKLQPKTISLLHRDHGGNARHIRCSD